jgi:hypothetical protein
MGLFSFPGSKMSGIIQMIAIGIPTGISGRRNRIQWSDKNGIGGRKIPEYAIFCEKRLTSSFRFAKNIILKKKNKSKKEVIQNDTTCIYL